MPCNMVVLPQKYVYYNFNLVVCHSFRLTNDDDGDRRLTTTAINEWAHQSAYNNIHYTKLFPLPNCLMAIRFASSQPQSVDWLLFDLTLVLISIKTNRTNKLLRQDIFHLFLTMLSFISHYTECQDMWKLRKLSNENVEENKWVTGMLVIEMSVYETK